MVVTRRQRENPLGWLFLGIGLCLFLSTDGGDYGYYAGVVHTALEPTHVSVWLDK
jgi:hypothetical protein